MKGEAEGLIDLRIFFDEDGCYDEGNCSNHHKDSGLPTMKNKGKGNSIP